MSGVDLSRLKSSWRSEVNAIAALSSDVRDSYSSEAGGNCRKEIEIHGKSLRIKECHNKKTTLED